MRMRHILRTIHDLPGYCRAFSANYHALYREHASARFVRFPRLATLRQLLDLRDGNPFILSDLAVYYLETEPPHY